MQGTQSTGPGRFSNETVVITGASSGIGMAAARLFAEEGARVVLFARGEDRLRAAREATGGVAVAGDVTDVADLQRLFAVANQDGGGVDVVLANAAAARLASIADSAEGLVDEVVGVNLKGTLSTLRHALPVLNDGASVVITTSWLNRIGFPGSSVLAMTKAALRSLARVAAAELAPRGIRVNALSPGAIETPLWAGLGLPDEALAEAGNVITAQIPLARWGTPDEIARAVLFLASDDSSYLTGTELQVDGGMRQT
jgi:NAD(P)-dependent dehydrogenase (short-subunit alcohol dehydrogenase family)